MLPSTLELTKILLSYRQLNTSYALQANLRLELALGSESALVSSSPGYSSYIGFFLSDICKVETKEEG